MNASVAERRRFAASRPRRAGGQKGKSPQTRDQSVAAPNGARPPPGGLSVVVWLGRRAELGLKSANGSAMLKAPNYMRSRTLHDGKKEERIHR